jgi:hypothetical protein
MNKRCKARRDINAKEENVMQKTKRSRWRTQMLPFVLVWGISIAIASLASGQLMRIFLFPLLTPEGAGIASNFIPVILTGVIQVFLVERLLKRSMRGWMLFTAVSGLVTLFLIHVVAKSYLSTQGPYSNFSIDLFMLVNYIAFYAPAPVIQFFWLRPRVKQAWLWPVSGILLMVMFSLRGFLSRDYSSEFLEAMVRFLSYSVIQASLMHYLWSRPRDAEKARVNFATSEQSSADLERMERLQTAEHERSNPLWGTSDEQALQSEA